MKTKFNKKYNLFSGNFQAISKCQFNHHKENSPMVHFLSDNDRKTDSFSRCQEILLYIRASIQLPK